VVQHKGVGAGKILGVRMIFVRILPNLPKNSIKSDLEKKVLYVILGAVGCHFCSYLQAFAKIFRDFVKVFWYFARISTDFSRIFTKSKLFVRTPASYISGAAQNRSAVINVKNRTRYDFQNKLK